MYVLMDLFTKMTPIGLPTLPLFQSGNRIYWDLKRPPSPVLFQVTNSLIFTHQVNITVGGTKQHAHVALNFLLEPTSSPLMDLETDSVKADDGEGANKKESCPEDT